VATDPPAQTPQPVRLADYKPPPWLVPSIELKLALDPVLTRVESTLRIRANPARPDRGALRLDGEMQRLVEIAVDGKVLGPADYVLDAASLTLKPPGETFTVRIVTEIAPETNTALEGLYLSGETLTTQCEAEGFRRITYFPDRPDVLAVYTTRLEADAARYPQLLSNGNRIAQGTLPGGRHFAEWHDPYPKPCYLFAVVAGDLARLEDSFTTRSDRKVALHLYVEPGNEPRARYALEALKRAMAWDEETFGLEYDLDVFQIVAVSAFNMGAMENKGLNIFNAKYILADAETATDQDYANIEAVVAHEYFHNWTGNRITCRDWFQLSLKEGLTVFRDQEFQADMRGRAVKRIADVRTLRTQQFPEDSGPLAHPVRPESYLEINNFYTATVYEKGAEVVRMLKVLLGKDGFRRGMDLYVERHDGSAATVEDFVKAMEDANGRPLVQFRRWYAQSGTPQLSARWAHEDAVFFLTLSQTTPPSPDQPQKEPLHIPVALGLVGPGGEALPVRLAGEPETERPTTRVIELTERETTFRFAGAPEGTVPSLLRGFSAPCRLIRPDDPALGRFLMREDEDPFNRWDACQGFAVTLMLRLTQGGDEEDGIDGLAAALARILAESDLDDAFRAAMLTLPSERDVAQLMPVIDVEGIFAARERVLSGLAVRLAGPLAAAYHGLALNEPYSPAPAQAGRRALRNAALRLLSARKAVADLALVAGHFENAGNMTDQVAALSILADHDGTARTRALETFYDRYRANSLVVDKWLTLQAGSVLPDVRARVEALTAHEAFTLKNPNKVRALIGSFAHNNMRGFHEPDGGGYRLLARVILELDRLNPQGAARLLTAFESWRRFDSARVALMQETLMSIQAASGLSPNLTELSARLLA
jgi:aminopeptidase N